MNEINGNEKWYTVKQCASEAGVSENTISLAIRNGVLGTSQISDSSRYGYHYLVSESSLLAWVEERKTKKANAVATRTPSEMTIEDIAAELTLRLKKAYEEGFRDGKKQAKREILDAMKGVK